MDKTIKLVIQILILAGIVFLGYFSLINGFKESLVAFLVLLISGLAYHLITDNQRSNLLLQVISIFIISTIVRLFFSYMLPKEEGILNVAHLLIILGFFLMVQELFKEIEIRFTFNKYTFVSLILMIANILFIYKIVALINSFKLGLSHTAFEFIFTIVEVSVLCFGLIGYLLSVRKYKKVTLLFLALALFLIGDLFDTLNYMFFMDDLFSEGMFIQYMFSLLGLFLFYKYCNYQNNEVVIES